MGYQAEGTLGRIILSGTSPVRILGQMYPVRAEVAQVKGVSGHADQNELLSWYRSIPQAPKTTFVVHGEPEASQSLATKLRELEPQTTIYVPQLGEVYKD